MHIHEVKTLLEDFVSDNKKRFLRENQLRAWREGRAMQDVKPSKHFPTALGDAIHNLMASLDHAYCILIKANGHTTTPRSLFPFSRTDWASVEAHIDGQIAAGNGPSEAVKVFIGDEVQPYPGGKHKIFKLRKLDIADKHQCILPTSADLYLKSAKIVDPRTGRVVANLKDVRARDSRSSNINISDHILIEESNLESAFDVTFGNGQPLDGKKILQTINILRNNVCTVLNGLETFI